jgi:pimeloyl-ACP methyl ester carboxylesterase
MATEIGHYVGNKRVAGTSGRAGDVTNPATGEVTAKVAFASEAEIDAAVQTAKKAQLAWAATPPLRRQRVMFNLKSLIEKRTDDLAKFITSFNAGPVHLIGWSHGGVVAATAAISDPSLVRSLILYEAGVLSVLPAESPEGKIVREDRARMFGPVVAAASETGDFIKAAKLLQEVVFHLRPGLTPEAAADTVWVIARILRVPTEPSSLR